MPKTKQLTQEQIDFLNKFLVNSTRKQEKKLTSEYKDFLRRKAKVLTDVYKLPPGSDARRALEDQVSQLDQNIDQGGTNFKGAYDSLEAVKKAAHRSARGLPPVSIADVEHRIDRLSRAGIARVIQAQAILKRVDDLCTELSKPENQASSKPTLQRATGFLIDFQGIEDDARTTLLNIANAQDALGREIEQFQAPQKAQDLRNESALLKELSPREAGHLPPLSDNVLGSFKLDGKPLTGPALAFAFEVKVTAFEEVIRACKNLEKFQQTEQEQAPDNLKELARRDRKRRAIARRQVKGEKYTDQLVLNVRKEDQKKVDLPFQWDVDPDYQDFTDTLPRTPNDITPQTTQQCRAAAKQVIQDLFTNKGNDSKLVLDMSIQTKDGLEALLGPKLEVQLPPNNPDVVAARDAAQRGDAWKTHINRYLEAKDRYLEDKNACVYAAELQGVLDSCNRNLNVDRIKNNPVAKKAYEDLKAAVEAELVDIVKVRDLIRSVAGEMVTALNEHAPNRASEETTQFQITVAGGQPEPFDIPSEFTHNGVRYTVKDFLGAGAMGATFRYEDDQGNSLVLKGNLDPSDEKTNAFAQEIRVHNHLMGGGAEEKKHVLKMEGAVRGPDGKLYMLMENAGGGNMDRLGQNARALGSAGVLSQEALNALNQHLVRQAVKGLRYLQNRNMTHHDIKCDNYFLDSEGTVKLADFGSSQVSDNPEGEVPNSDAIEAAPELRAPEFKAKANLSPILTPKADTYTLGVMISMLTSPMGGSEKDDDFTSPRTLTALDRLKNAMLDPDPQKRPTIEAVEYSTYLEDEVDPQLAQNLLQASMDYSKKVGKEVADKQGDINFLRGIMTKGKGKKDEGNTDAVLTRLMEGNAKTVELIRGELATAFEKRTSLLSQLDGIQNDAAYAQIFINTIGDVFTAIINAESYYRLANLDDDAIKQEIANARDVAERARAETNKAIENAAARLQQDIAQINSRDDVKPFVDQVKQAQDALLRGPQDPQQALTPEKQEKAVLLRKQRLSKAIDALIGKDTTKAWSYSENLEAAEDYATLGQFDLANTILDGVEKEMHKKGGQKLFEAQMKEAITQLQTAQLDQPTKANLEKLLREAMGLLGKRDLDGAYVPYQQVARYLRNLEVAKAL